MHRQEVGARGSLALVLEEVAPMELCCDLRFWQVLLLLNWEWDRGSQGALKGTHVSQSGSQGRMVGEVAGVGCTLKVESVKVTYGTDECERGVKGDIMASGLREE